MRLWPLSYRVCHVDIDYNMILTQQQVICLFANLEWNCSEQSLKNVEFGVNWNGTCYKWTLLL